MDKIEFVQLFDIEDVQIIDLMNNEMVGRQLPLLTDRFTEEKCRTFLAAKKRLWDEHGYGPWAFLIEGQFAGWGGVQPEHGEADFALVLHPKFWGWGRKIFNKVRDQAFGPMNLDSITILLPPSRPNSKAVTRLGFTNVGQIAIGGEQFLRYRLSKNRS